MNTTALTSPEFRASQVYQPGVRCGSKDFSVLHWSVQGLVGQLDKQSERWVGKPYFKASIENRRIAVQSGYHRSGKMVQCLMGRNPYDHSGGLWKCNLGWFCPYCAYLRGQDLLKKYVGSWDPDAWYMLTMSIGGNGIEVTDPDHDTLEEVWSAMGRVMRRLCKIPGYQGHFGIEELFVNQFWPRLRWTPHLHILVRSIAELDREALNRIVRSEWYRSGPAVDSDPKESIRSPVNLQVQRPNSEAHFYKQTSYTKTIDLLTPYDSGFQEANKTGQLDWFHQEVRLFFEAYSVEGFKDQTRKSKGGSGYSSFRVERGHLHYGGACHGLAKNPLGVPKAQRRTEEHQDYVRALVAMAGAREKDEQKQAHQSPIALQESPSSEICSHKINHDRFAT